MPVFPGAADKRFGKLHFDARGPLQHGLQDLFFKKRLARVCYMLELASATGAEIPGPGLYPVRGRVEYTHHRGDGVVLFFKVYPRLHGLAGYGAPYHDDLALPPADGGPAVYGE